MKKLLPIILLFCAVVFAGCEKYEYGYIDSLEGTVWQSTWSSTSWWILDFQPRCLIRRIEEKNGESSTETGFTWHCASDGRVSIYWDKCIAPGPYMTGTFDKYKGTLVIDGWNSKWKLINKK